MLLSQIKIEYQRQLMRYIDERVGKQWKWKVSKKTFKFWPVYRDIFRAQIFLDNHGSGENQTPMFSEFDLAVRRDPARSATTLCTLVAAPSRVAPLDLVATSFSIEFDGHNAVVPTPIWD